MDIFKPNNLFDFTKIKLSQPQPVQGGSFFTKISLGEEEKPFYIQLPKCITKQGIVSTKRGKYCDLMYKRNNYEEFMDWLEQLETSCHDNIDKKKDLWFTGDYSKEEIEQMMTPIMRLYKSCKYVLIRTYINTNKHTGEDNCSAYNENEVGLNLEDIDNESMIIPLLLIDGIKFTSRSFELDFKIIQMMVLNKPINEISTCLIKKNNNLGNLHEKLEFLPINKEIPTQVVEETPTQVVEETPTQVVEETTTQVVEEAPTQVIEEEEEEEQEDVELLKKDNINNLEENDGIEEFILDVSFINNNENENETIKLKKPNEVYYNIYKAAREKAKNMRHLALEAIMEAKNIKTKYLLEDINDSDEDVEDIEDN